MPKSAVEMDLKMGNPSDKRPGASGAVQWCFYVFVIASCGYSLLRQQRLEQRLRVLEDQHLQLEATFYGLHEPQEEVLTRKARDVTDCVCPSEITLQKKWKGIRGCYTRELKRQEKLKAGFDPGTRKSQYLYFKQLSFLRNIVTSRPTSSGNVEYLFNEEPANDEEVAIKEENFADGESSSDNFEEDDSNDYFNKPTKLNTDNKNPKDPLGSIKHQVKKTRYDTNTDDDLLFLLSMLKTLKRVPRNKIMATRIKLMAVLDEATRDLED